MRCRNTLGLPSLHGVRALIPKESTAVSVNKYNLERSALDFMPSMTASGLSPK